MKIKYSLIIIFQMIVLLYPIQVFCGDQNSASQTSKSSQSTPKDVYRIGAGDILQITTWKEVDFTLAAVIVRIDGNITIPLLDDIQAAGRTPAELKKAVQKALAKYVENPIVTVSVTNPASQKFYILGEVARTGEYDLVKNLTVLQAFAIAGGFTEWASKKEIILMRREDGQEKIFTINYKKLVKGKDFSQNLKIKADDTIIVP